MKNTQRTVECHKVHVCMYYTHVTVIVGTLIRRHKIPLPPPNDDQFYTIQHLNVDQKIQFYSKTFQITVIINTYAM